MMKPSEKADLFAQVLQFSPNQISPTYEDYLAVEYDVAVSISQSATSLLRQVTLQELTHGKGSEAM